ncbi:MAG: hypothetical protein RBS73_04360 [Prolixibacteraceae bacterium]|jgi:hypothetical protein|nr:hypothetical protein [Prolixibacteraceae bacterium]
MKLEKALNIMMWALVAISAFLIISLMANISENKEDPAMGSWLNTNLTWSYILLIATIVIVVLFGLFQTVSDKAATKSALVSLGCAAVIFIISYSLASNEIPKFYGVEKFVTDGTLTGTISKWIDTTLIATYILFVLTLVATIFWSVSHVFKK